MIPKLFSGYLIPFSGEMIHYHYLQQLVIKPLPTISTTSLLEKIDKIMSFLRPIETRFNPSEYLKTNYTTKQRINKFELTTTTAVTQLIKKSQAQMCELDPMPSSLVKEHAAVLAPIITQIKNKSMDKGTVSKNLKNAILKPLLKKQGLAPILAIIIQSLIYHTFQNSLRKYLVPSL